MSRPVTLLQFTDTHLYADLSRCMDGVQTSATLTELVEKASATETFDYVVVTGDISQDFTVESYDHLADIIGRLNKPVYTLPGNHDDPSIMKDSKPIHEGLFQTERSFVAGHWLMVLLDSTIKNRHVGELGETEMNRLDSLLKEHSDKFALICLHHNPINMKPDREDLMMLSNAEQFFDLINRYEKVRGVIWGHVHQEFLEERNGVKYMASPSSCVQYTPAARGVTVDPRPPGYRRLQLHDDGTIETEVVRLDKVPEGLILKEHC